MTATRAHLATVTTAHNFALAATVIAAAVISFPHNFTPPFEGGIDADWQCALHEIAARGLAMGPDVEFTFGPLGYAFLPRYHPATAPTVVAAMMTLGAIVAFALWHRFKSVASIPARSAATLFVAVVVSGATSPDVPLYFVCVLLLIEGLSPDRNDLIVTLLAVATGAVLLAKLTVAATATVALAAVSVRDLSARRVPFAALTSFVTFVAGWRLSGQEFSAFPLFFRRAGEISSGHVVAMGQGNELGIRSFTDPFLFALVAACLAGFVLLVERDRTVGWLHAFALLAFLFVLAKAAFVRHDLPHVFIGIEVLLLTSIAYAPWVVRRREREVVVLIGFAIGIACLVILTTWRPTGTFLNRPARLVRLPLQSVRNALDFAMGGEALRAEFDARARAYRDGSQVLRTVNGSFDALSIGQAAVVAWDLDWSPRPTIQSYLAYSEGSMERNAQHFRSLKAPEFLWLTLHPVDGRWPVLDDARALREILTRYELAEDDVHGPLLRRRPVPLPLHVERLRSKTVALGDRIALPDGCVWITVDVRPSVFGRIATMLLRPSLLVLRAKIENDAAPREFRFVPSIAREGFIASPAVRNSNDFVRLIAEEPLAEVEWIEITEPSRLGMWQRQVGINVSRLSRAATPLASTGTD
ncbi:MAG: hypothetical protein ACYC7A_00360 [Thermoanaerobaculia bacterium]